MPITVRRSIELVGLFTAGMIIAQGKQVLMPLLLAFLLSILLLPVYRFFRRIRFHEILAIALSVIILLTIVAGIVWLFSSQVGKLIADFPQIKENILTHLNHLSLWIDEKTHFTTQQQLRIINDQSDKMLDNTGDAVGKALGSVTGLLTYMGLVPIYIFLILVYKDLLVRFLFMWFRAERYEKVHEAMLETESIIKSYLVGLLIQITYLIILLGGSLWLLGIDHALLIGIIFAIMNLIPYVGPLVAVVIAVLLTLSSTQELWPVLTVLLAITGVQFLDNNILMPRIVGSKVRINALASISAVFIGGALAGVPGMFLSLPMIALLKVIFDRTENMKQWGVLLGDDTPRRTRKKRKQPPSDGQSEAAVTA